MPIKVIKRANKGNIVFQSNANYEQLYSSILRVLGRDAPFAQLVAQGSMLQWKPVDGGSYKSITEAPDEVLVLWEQTRKKLAKRLAAENMEFVLDIPDLSFVFYKENPSAENGILNNKYKLLITGWACRYGHNENNDGDDSARTKIVEAQKKHQNVIVKMQDSKKHPLGNASFLYVYDNSHEGEMSTDATGCFEQGLCLVGAKLTYTYKQTGQRQSLTVMKNIEVYPLTFAPQVTIHVKVIDQFNRPVQSHLVRADYGGKVYAADTDGLGNVDFPDILYLDASLQVSVEVDGLGKGVFPVECPDCHITMRVEIPEEVTYYLKVMAGSEPIPSHSIKLEGAVNGIYATNTDGLVSLGQLKVGDTFSAQSATMPEAEMQHFLIAKGQIEYVYLLPEPVTEPEPEPEPEPDPEPPKTAPELDGFYVKVVQGEEKTPVPNYSLRFESDVMNGLRLTDENGIVLLENVTVGLRFNVYGEKQAPYVFEIKAEQKEYLIQIDNPEEKPHVHVQACRVKLVAGEEATPVPDYLLRFESDSINGYHKTDKDGIVSLGDVSVGTLVKVFASGLQEPVQLKIVEGKVEYIVNLPAFDPKVPKDYLCHIKLVKGEQMLPVGNHSLRIESDTMHGNFMTDSYGILPLKNMSIGEQVTCFVNPNEPDSVSFSIEEGKEEYIIRMEEEKVVTVGDVMVTLLDKDKVTPVSPAVITLTNKKKERFVRQNDVTGSIIVPRTFFTDGQKILFHAENDQRKIRDCKILYSQTCDHYYVYLTDRFNWKRLMWLFLLPLILLLSFIQCERDITVRTIDTKGNAVPNAAVQLAYTEHALYKDGEFFLNRSQNRQGITNAEGYYTFKKLPCSVYSYIFYCFQPAMAVGSRNATVKGEEKFWFHWRKEVNVTLTNKRVVQVRSSRTNQPLQQAQVDVCLTDASSTDWSAVTDEKGECVIEASANESLAHFAQLTATKPGYSGTRIHDVDINPNDTLPLLVYLDQPEPCQDKVADNLDRSQGNVSMRDYDMKISKGNFVFAYYTDSAPDEITVYDGTSSDYVRGTAPCIFHYEGATNTTSFEHYEIVKFTSRYICVVVTGGTNWGYNVNCPEHV